MIPLQGGKHNYGLWWVCINGACEDGKKNTKEEN